MDSDQRPVSIGSIMASPQTVSAAPRTPPPPPRPLPGTVLQPAAARPWQHWNTLQKLWAWVYILWAIDAVVLLSVVLGAQAHRDAMKSIGKDTAPSIIQAQHIKSALADMDSDLANALLTNASQTEDTLAAYDKPRREAATALIEAAKNITFDREEQEPIEQLQVNMVTF